MGSTPEYQLELSEVLSRKIEEEWLPSFLKLHTIKKHME